MRDRNARVPSLRFPEFRDAGPWEEKRLGEVSTFSKGKGISKADVSPDGSQPCIRYGELYTHYKEAIDMVVSYTNISPANLVLSQANDVIIPASGETQIDIATASCVMQSGIALGGDLNIIRSEIGGVFLSYYLNGTKKKSIAEMAQGISVVHLYPNQLTTLKIGIPKPAEQQKIATCLTSIADLITAQAQKLDSLKTHKKGLMQQLFPADGETIPSLRFPEFRDAGPWEVKRLGEVLNIEMGQSPASHSYNENQIGVPLIQGNADISNRLSAPRRYTSEPTKLCNVGDILLSVRAPIGEVSLSQHNACIGRGVAALRSRKNSILSFWIQFLLQYEPKWHRLGQGSTFTAISSPDIKNLNVLLPHPPEQQKIADCLSSIDDLITAQGQKLDGLKAHKKGLMQQLFPAADKVNA